MNFMQFKKQENKPSLFLEMIKKKQEVFKWKMISQVNPQKNSVEKWVSPLLTNIMMEKHIWI